MLFIFQSSKQCLLEAKHFDLKNSDNDSKSNNNVFVFSLFQDRTSSHISINLQNNLIRFVYLPHI